MKEFVVVYGNGQEARVYGVSFPDLLQKLRKEESSRAFVEIYEVVTRQELIWRKEK